MAEPHTWAEQVAAVTRRSVPRQLGAIPVFYPILTDLGLRDVVNAACPIRSEIDRGRLALVLTLNRLMAPQPLYHVGRWFAQTVLPEQLELSPHQVYDTRLGRDLDALHPVLGEMWLQLAARAVQHEGVDTSVIHWDTTTFYFEGQYDDSDLARYGHGADGQSECKRAKIGLNVTHRERLPTVYHLLAGNSADISLPVSNLEALLAFLQRPELGFHDIHPLIISDGKMITPPLVAAAHQHDLLYLGPWQADEAVEATLHSASSAELAAHPLAYRPRRQATDPNFTPYQAVWRPFSIPCVGQTFVDRGLVVWSENNRRLDEDKRKHHLKALLDRLDYIRQHLNTGRYIRATYTAQQIAFAQRGNPAKSLVDVELSGSDRALRLTFATNHSKLAEAIDLDGKYLLGTNQPGLTADQALAYYKGQDGIEKRNAVLKGPLQVRPVYVQTDQRIEGLVFFNLVALLAWAILELRCQRAGLPYTGQRVLDEFAPLSVTDQVFVDDSRLQQIGDVSDFQQAVLDGLQLPPVDHYLAATSPKG